MFLSLPEGNVGLPSSVKIMARFHGKSPIKNRGEKSCEDHDIMGYHAGLPNTINLQFGVVEIPTHQNGDFGDGLPFG